MRRFGRMSAVLDPSTLVALFAVAALAVSLPFRIAAGVGTVNLAKVTYGFQGWEVEPNGTRFQWTGRRATLFVPAGTSAIELPLRAFEHPGAEVTEVDVRVDRGHSRRLRLRGNHWFRLRLSMPATDRRFHRVDLYVPRTWTPSESGSADDRELGVKVGEIQTMPARTGPERQRESP